MFYYNAYYCGGKLCIVQSNALYTYLQLPVLITVGESSVLYKAMHCTPTSSCQCLLLWGKALYCTKQRIVHLPPVASAYYCGGKLCIVQSLMVRWVVGSILHGVDPLSYFSFQPVLHDWCNKGRGMCYPVCGMVHIKEPLLLIDKSSLCGSSRFPFSL